MFPREEVERLAKTIPDATLKVYPETGHAVHWERPEEVGPGSGGVHERLTICLVFSVLCHRSLRELPRTPSHAKF